MICRTLYKPLKPNMNLNNYTVKAAEIIQAAQQIAYNGNHAAIESEHLLKALLDQQDSPIEYLLKKNAVNIPQVQSQVEQLLNKLPTVQSGEPAQTLSRDANNALLRAGAALKSFGDEFITPEHL